MGVVAQRRDEPEVDYTRLLEFRTGLRQFLRWSDRAAKEAGITSAQHQLLLAVRGHPDPRGPSINEVAEYLALAHQSTVGLVNRTVKAGLVERYQATEDRRVSRLRLTAAGRRLLARLSQAHVEELARLAPRLRILWRGLGPGWRPPLA
jgi:DNA-binding MarR family transcriptional regulator